MKRSPTMLKKKGEKNKMRMRISFIINQYVIKNRKQLTTHTEQNKTAKIQKQLQVAIGNYKQNQVVQKKISKQISN